MRTDGLEEADIPLVAWLSASQDAARMSGRLAAPQGILPAGTVVGEWELTGFLGRGGSAEVYCARHLRLGTPAALKVLHRIEEGPKGRFDREVRFLMSNPGASFPAFYGAGVHGERPWMAMELLEDYPPPGDDAGVAAYLLDVAAGVTVLHERGWLHRDLKPANILRRADGHAVLADFGLLRPIGEDPAERAAAGGLESVVDGREAGVGTPGYSAPEQFSGGDLTPATDVFALGMLANECFGGKPPRVWERIIRRATAFLPRQRYADVAVLLRAMHRRNRARNWRRGLLAVLGVSVAMLLGLKAVRGKEVDQDADRAREAAVRRVDTGLGKAVVEEIIRDMVPLEDSNWIVNPYREVVGLPNGPVLLGRHEVTQAQWEALMEHNPSRFRGADRPVEGVSFGDCLEFVGRLNRTAVAREAGLRFRLPTGTEWDWAVGGQAAKYDNEALLERGWFEENSNGMTHPVGEKTPDNRGLFDLCGNVAEPVFEFREVEVSGTFSVHCTAMECKGGSFDRSMRDALTPPILLAHLGRKIPALPEEWREFVRATEVSEELPEGAEGLMDLLGKGTVGLRLCADKVGPGQELP